MEQGIQMLPSRWNWVVVRALCFNSRQNVLFYSAFIGIQRHLLVGPALRARCRDLLQIAPSPQRWQWDDEGPH